ncbi:MAG: aldehyde dehydrogenase family protein [Actinomycetota bacterium]|nr:aldehyde dehydrogenase family protein [Actinomycetota bacterium]
MTSLHESPSATDHGPLVAHLRTTFNQGSTRPLEWRRTQLRSMAQMLADGESEFLDALAADLGKPAIEGWMTELRHVTNEIDHILHKLADWAAPQRVRVRAMLRPSKASIVPEPLGVALVIAPWNYPLHLLLLPMAYALAAGNAVVGKPSEISSRTAAALARWVPRYLDERAVAIVEGDAPVVTSLLKERWDHIFYTGNATVGRIVMAAAVRHLTPVTLELGGKSPTIVDRNANLAVAARRVAWGKFVNAGQTCVAPDYVLVDRRVEGPFVELLTKEVASFYGPEPKASADLTRIVSDRHFDRLQELLEGRTSGRVVVGGDSDRSQRYLAPTILSDVSWDEAVMRQEIFGPILPVLTVDGLDEAIATVNAHEKPLALYVFSEDQAAIDRVVAETSSGGVCVNGTLLHLAVTDLPFGGVGESGMGAYHGKAGFDAFSHRKSVFQRGTRPDPAVMYPPYGRVKQWLLRRSY